MPCNLHLVAAWAARMRRNRKLLVGDRPARAHLSGPSICRKCRSYIAPLCFGGTLARLCYFSADPVGGRARVLAAKVRIR